MYVFGEYAHQQPHHNGDRGLMDIGHLHDDPLTFFISMRWDVSTYMVRMRAKLIASISNDSSSAIYLISIINATVNIII